MTGHPRSTARLSVGTYQASPSHLRSTLENIRGRTQRWPLVGPRQDGIERRAEGLTPLGELVFHLWWYLRVDRSHHEAVGLQTTQLLPEHLLRDGGYRPLQVGEAHHLAAEEVKENHQLPAALEQVEGRFDVVGG